MLTNVKGTMKIRIKHWKSYISAFKTCVWRSRLIKYKAQEISFKLINQQMESELVKQGPRIGVGSNQMFRQPMMKWNYTRKLSNIKSRELCILIYSISLINA